MILISNRAVKSDTVKMAIISVLNWLWRKSIDLFHLWKTGFRSEFALKWNQFGGLLTQCLGTTGPHHTITLLLLFSLVAFTLERQGIIGERKSQDGVENESWLRGNLTTSSQVTVLFYRVEGFDGLEGRSTIDSTSWCQDSYLYRESLSFTNTGYVVHFLFSFEIEIKFTLKNSQWE